MDQIPNIHEEMPSADAASDGEAGAHVRYVVAHLVDCKGKPDDDESIRDAHGNMLTDRTAFLTKLEEAVLLW